MAPASTNANVEAQTSTAFPTEDAAQAAVTF